VVQQHIYIAYIGLGSNQGEREQFLADAKNQLQQHPSVEIASESPIYETDPVGYLEQAAFLNQVIAVRTGLSPSQLYHEMAAAELRLGRIRDIRWGPRTIDLDLLLLYKGSTSGMDTGFDRVEVQSAELSVPHPRMRERAFVLIPLLDVLRPMQPEDAVSLEQDLDKLEGKEGVRLWKRTKSPNA
jgi:2-amino-4-hydroxy-6-hydroxymethyldihydropteridine diphosphokinase